MFFGDNVHDIRTMYYSSWRKYQLAEPLTSLEQQVVDVINNHPEYHALLSDEAAKNAAYFPELGQTNPFLHMGLHLAIREQIATNRPAGITTIFQKLLVKYIDNLTVEHLMIDRLAEALWLAQKNQTMPDEVSYLESLKQI